MDRNTRDHYQRRERAERAFAEIAATPEAREIHLELARKYADRLKEAGLTEVSQPHDSSPAPAPVPNASSAV